MLLEGDPVPALPGAVGGQRGGAERVAAEAGDGPLGDHVLVVAAGQDGAGGEELGLAGGGAVEEEVLQTVDGVLDGDGGFLELHHLPGRTANFDPAIEEREREVSQIGRAHV